MKHFQDPLTHFARDALLGTQSLSQSAQKLGQPTSFNFLDSLVTRLWSDHSSPERTLPDAMIDSRSLSISSLLSSVSSAHAAAQQRARNLRLGFSVTRIISRFMMDQGYKVSSTSNGNIGFGLDLMLSAARGRLSKDLKYLGMMVR